MVSSASRFPEYQVVCICGGHGFPHGTATAARITLIGRALQQAGVPFRLLHCGPSPIAVNTDRTGTHEGIPFQYTTTTRRPSNKFLRFLVYLWAVAELTLRLVRLWPLRRSTVIYLYLMEGPLVLYVGLLSRCLGIPIVQELCEWLPGDPCSNRFTNWLHKKAMFQSAAGALVISKAIEKRVRERCTTYGLDVRVLRIPALIDPAPFLPASQCTDLDTSVISEFLYCGTWTNDIFFVIRAFQLVRLSGYQCRLRLLVGANDGIIPSIIEYAAAQGISSQDFTLMGYVDVSALGALYRSAIALLMPLRNDDRSVTRLPNKMSEYLASGRPIVTSEIGDCVDLLTDNVNAYMAKPGDERSFADKMIAVLDQPARATEIGAAGQRICLSHLDFRPYSGVLSSFFSDCINGKRNALNFPSLFHLRLSMILRNLLCGLFASLIVISGRTRTAKKNALNSHAVTSIYFHNPNKRLFTKCVRWLKRQGYVFISIRQLIDIVHGRLLPPKGAVWLSFDDGFKELLTSVVPVVRQEKVSVTIFVSPGIIAEDGLFPWLHRDGSGPSRNDLIKTGVRDAMTVSELKEIAKYPEVGIGSHTVNHVITVNLDDAELCYEIGESKRQLEAWLGSPVTSFAYPVGQFDGREGKILSKCGYEIAATTVAARILNTSYQFEIPRFHVGDNIPFSEAVCNMVGVWRPVIDPPKRFLRRWRVLSNAFH